MCADVHYSVCLLCSYTVLYLYTEPHNYLYYVYMYTVQVLCLGLRASTLKNFQDLEQWRLLLVTFRVSDSVLIHYLDFKLRGRGESWVVRGELPPHPLH